MQTIYFTTHLFPPLVCKEGNRTAGSVKLARSHFTAPFGPSLCGANECGVVQEPPYFIQSLSSLKALYFIPVHYLNLVLNKVANKIQSTSTTSSFQLKRGGSINS